MCIDFISESSKFAIPIDKRIADLVFAPLAANGLSLPDPERIAFAGYAAAFASSCKLMFKCNPQPPSSYYSVGTSARS